MHDFRIVVFDADGIASATSCGNSFRTWSANWRVYDAARDAARLERLSTWRGSAARPIRGPRDLQHAREVRQQRVAFLAVMFVPSGMRSAPACGPSRQRISSISVPCAKRPLRSSAANSSGRSNGRCGPTPPRWQPMHWCSNACVRALRTLAPTRRSRRLRSRRGAVRRQRGRLRRDR